MSLAGRDKQARAAGSRLGEQQRVRERHHRVVVAGDHQRRHAQLVQPRERPRRAHQRGELPRVAERVRRMVAAVLAVAADELVRRGAAAAHQVAGVAS